MGRRRKTVTERVIEVLAKAHGEPLKPRQIAEAAEANYNSVRKALYTLLRERRVHRYMGGYILSEYYIEE